MKKLDFKTAAESGKRFRQIFEDGSKGSWLEVRENGSIQYSYMTANDYINFTIEMLNAEYELEA